MIFNKITGIEFRPYLRFCLLPWDYLQVKSEIHVFFKNFHAYNDDFFFTYSDKGNIEAWGHEYIRHLSGEIVSEWNSIDSGEKEGEDGGTEVEMTDTEAKENLLK